MADSPAPETLVVQSHRGPYSVHFVTDALTTFVDQRSEADVVIIDDLVADLYAEQLGPVLSTPSTLGIPACEPNKSLERCPDYVDHLVAAGIRRGNSLVAIGGGIIQDIACFLASTLLRGLDWRFIPTTLLAQTDSCIGSKSSINVHDAKNIVGTFTPPTRVDIDVAFLGTLAEADLRSGIGEMLKVHAIAGPDEFDAIAADYERLVAEPEILQRYVARSLGFKRVLIELDEFDQGPRNVMNYGHSFGHAIESATGYGIPHGIAITIGMDMANHVARDLGVTTATHAQRMHPTLAANYRGFEHTDIPLDKLLGAIAKDKKNTATELRLILPGTDGVIGIVQHPADDTFRDSCGTFLTALSAQQ
jgi:3-dehydroquinate synthase